MSIFNLGFFNAGNVFQLLNQIPTPSTYSNIKLFGNCTVDDLWGISRVMNTVEIGDLDLEIEPVWTVDTFLLALFENNLQGGNIVSLPTPIDSWLLLRRGQNDAKFTKIAELGAAVDSYVDRKASSKEIYTYSLIPVADNLLGETLLADPVQTDFTKVILLDDTTNEGYSFCLDLAMSDIATEEDISINTTKGKYETILKGNKNIKVGTIGMILTSNSITDNELLQDANFIDEFEAFIQNNNSKLLKFPKGFTYRVSTADFNKIAKDGYDSAGNIIYRCSFSYRQIGEVM